MKIKGQVKTFVANLIAQYKTAPDIKKLALEIHKVSLTSTDIYAFKSANSGLIEKLREKFLEKTSDIPIAQERIRLEREEELYQLSQKVEKKESKVILGLSCLREAREETKVRSPSEISFNQYNEFRELSDQDLMLKLQEIRRQVTELVKKEGDVYAVDAKGREGDEKYD